MRQAGLAPFPAEEHAVKSGEQPRLDLGAVAKLMALAGKATESFLSEFTGVIAVAGQAQREGEEPLIVGFNNRVQICVHAEYEASRSEFIPFNIPNVIARQGNQARTSQRCPSAW